MKEPFVTLPPPTPTVDEPRPTPAAPVAPSIKPQRDIGATIGPTESRFRPLPDPAAALQPPPADRHPAGGKTRRRFGQWLNRPRRVLLTLACVWTVGVFDLAFTLLESTSSRFIELNPVAARVLTGSDHDVTVFKFGLLGLSTVILLALRRHAVAECACWFLLGLKLFLAARWFAYYECLDRGGVNPFVMIEAAG